MMDRKNNPTEMPEAADGSDASVYTKTTSFTGSLKIRTKLLIVLVLVAVVSVGIYSAVEYRAAKRALLEESFDTLVAVRELKAQQIEDYFSNIAGQVATLSESSMIVDAMQEFRAAIDLLDEGSDGSGLLELQSYYEQEFLPRLNESSLMQAPAQAEAYLPQDPIARWMQGRFIAQNPNPTGEKHLLDAGITRSSVVFLRGSDTTTFS